MTEGTDGTTKRLGVMGGTFDPVHYGHLVAAEMALNEFRLEKVVFIPAGNPPHKRDRSVTPGDQRLEMVRLALVDNRFFEASPLELERQGESYTVDTLKHLHRLYPDHELFFITGSDALREIYTWKDVHVILELCHFIGATRPGFATEDFVQALKVQHPQDFERVHLLEVPALSISSTDIRERVKKKKSIRYLLPEAVRVFIEKEGLYLQGDAGIS